MRKMNYKYIVIYEVFYETNSAYKLARFEYMDEALGFIYSNLDFEKQFISLVTISKMGDNHIYKEALKILKKKADVSVVLQYGNGNQTFKKGTNQKCQIAYADWNECIDCYVDITEDEYEILDQALKDLEEKQ